MHIDSYSFGSMTVDGKEYTADLMIFPDRVRPDWWRQEGHLLRLGDLAEVLKYAPEVLVIGKGAAGIMQVPLAVKEALEKIQAAEPQQSTEQPAPEATDLDF